MEELISRLFLDENRFRSVLQDRISAQNPLFMARLALDNYRTNLLQTENLRHQIS